MLASSFSNTILHWVCINYLGYHKIPDSWKVIYRSGHMVNWVLSFVMIVCHCCLIVMVICRCHLYYSKFAKDHFFDVRYFVHIITIYNQIATKGKSMFGPHKRVMQLLI